jgi:type I restriction enzyme S subunit
MKYRLGDICTITKGETGIMKAIPGAYTMVALGEANKTHNEFQFDTKAVIVPLVSSTGHGHASMKRVKYQEGKFALGSILCAVIPKDEKVILAKYLHIYLHWNREELLVSQMKGMANVSLPMNKIADVIVIVPSIEKQKEIIALEKRLVEKELEADKLFADQLTELENLIQAILQEAVQGKLVKQDLKDQPAVELLKRIKSEKEESGKKEKPLPSIKPEEIPFKIPENWVWCRLGEIGEPTIGIIFKPSQVGKVGIPVLRANNVQNNKIDYSNLILVDTVVREKQIANIGDILICVRSGSNNLIGKSAIIEKDGMSFGAFMSLYRSKFNDFVYHYMTSRSFKKQIDDKKSTGINQLTQGTLNGIIIPFPPQPEQKRIVAEIEKQLAKTKQLKEHIIANQHATEQLLKALLHQAFEVEEMEEVQQ